MYTSIVRHVGSNTVVLAMWAGMLLGTCSGAGAATQTRPLPHAKTTPDEPRENLRTRLRDASAKFLEASPGRGLPVDITAWEFRLDIWPKVSARCDAFTSAPGGAGAEVQTPELLAIAGDAEELPRAREMALWLLCHRIIEHENQGRSTSLLRLPAFGPEGIEGLAEKLAMFLESHDRITRYSAVAVLAAHGGPDTAPVLVRVIKGPYVAERERACRGIGRFGIDGFGTDGIGLLRPLLSDRPDVSGTMAAADALLLAGTREFEEHGTTTAIDELVTALRYAPHAGVPRDRKDFGGWEPGKQLVIGFSPEEVSSGARADAFVRYAASLALRQVDVHALQWHVFDAMLAALGDDEVAVVDNAFRFVIAVGVRGADWNAEPALDSLLRAPHPMLNTMAAWTIAQWGERGERFVPMLIDRTDALTAQHQDLFFHIWALGNIGDERAEKYLAALKERIGPDTRPRDEEGNLFNNDVQYRKLIDDGIARIRRLREIRNSPDRDAVNKALDEAMKEPRRRYLSPTLLGIVRDPSRDEELRVRCATLLRELDPVAAPTWFAELLKSDQAVPGKLREVLEAAPPGRVAEP
ncbi:MAG: hypothetical protein AB7O77_08945 [Phycisphaerales bacterium]